MVTYEEFKDYIDKNIYSNLYYSTSIDYIGVEWVSGGLTGGNCWKGNASYARDPDEVPEFESLNKIILEFAPNLPFRVFHKLNELIETGNVNGPYEYYGNETIYGYKRIDIKKLYEFLKENS